MAGSSSSLELRPGNEDATRTQCGQAYVREYLFDMAQTSHTASAAAATGQSWYPTPSREIIGKLTAEAHKKQHSETVRRVLQN